MSEDMQHIIKVMWKGTVVQNKHKALFNRDFVLISEDSILKMEKRENSQEFSFGKPVYD